MPSRFSLSSLTRQLRWVLGAALVFNVIVLGVLIWLVVSTAAEPLPLVTSLGPSNTIECENNAALNLRQQGVSGSVTISGSHSLQVFINDTNASAAWTVFSTTLTLLKFNCGPYSIVRVDVPDPNLRPNTRLILDVNSTDIQAWSNNTLDDGQLSDRMRRRLYQTP